MSQPTPSLTFPPQFGISQKSESELAISVDKKLRTYICLFTSNKLGPDTAQYTLTTPSSKTPIATGLANKFDSFYPSTVEIRTALPNSKPVTVHMNMVRPFESSPTSCPRRK